MNIYPQNIISDITGDVGLKILRDIAAGHKNPKTLANYRTDRYKGSQENFEKSLEENYKPEHVLNLKQAIEFHDFCHEKIYECDKEIESTFEKIAEKI